MELYLAVITWYYLLNEMYAWGVKNLLNEMYAWGVNGDKFC